MTKQPIDHELSDPESALLHLKAALDEGEDVFACAILDVYDVWFATGPEAITVMHGPTLSGSKPLPWLRAEEVTEEGVYWWKIKSNAKAIPIVVMRIKGQLYYDNRGWLFRMGTSKAEGLWQRIPEPTPPKEVES